MRLPTSAFQSRPWQKCGYAEMGRRILKLGPVSFFTTEMTWMPGLVLAAAARPVIRARQIVPKRTEQDLMARYLSGRHIKRHRNYTIAEISDLLGVHKNTVCAWIKAGLKTIDKRRPTLVLGTDLKSFLDARKAANKKPCRSDQIYCLRCRTPQTPPDGLVEYVPTHRTLGTLKSLCPICGTLMFRRINPIKSSRILERFGLTVPMAIERIDDGMNAFSNCDKDRCDETNC